MCGRALGLTHRGGAPGDGRIKWRRRPRPQRSLVTMWSRAPLESIWSTLAAPRRRHLDLGPAPDDDFSLDDYFTVDVHRRVQVTLAALSARQRGEGVALPQFSRSASGSATSSATSSSASKSSSASSATTSRSSGASGASGASSASSGADDGADDDLSLENCHLLFVAFKGGRLDVFYLATTMVLAVGDLVIVEADRGRDLGRVAKLAVLIDEARMFKMLQHYQQQLALVDERRDLAPPVTFPFPKPVLRAANAMEVSGVAAKARDEDQACRQFLVKLRHTALALAPTNPLRQMRLVDAEYQFDRRKLTFYYALRQRIDFRDLVRELFRFYKTRIWMLAVTGVPYVVPEEAEAEPERWYTPQRVGFGLAPPAPLLAPLALLATVPGRSALPTLPESSSPPASSSSMLPLIGGVPERDPASADTANSAEAASAAASGKAAADEHEHSRLEPLLASLVHSINLG